MVRRSRLEIYFDVLEVIEKGIVKPTQIMYKTNLSWVTLNEVFNTLIKSDFIKEEQKRKSKRYYITDKGKSALSHHRTSIRGLGLTPLIE